MNIFAVDSNPRVAARCLCDRHICKMGIEAAQILSYSHHMQAGWCPELVPQSSGAYRMTGKTGHSRHPCVLWCCKSERYDWLAQHGLEILKEYSRRYGRQHATMPRMRALAHHNPWPLDGGSWTDALLSLPQCMPDVYKVPGDPVSAYRAYYNGDKSRFAKWNHSEVPDWYVASVPA